MYVLPCLSRTSPEDVLDAIKHAFLLLGFYNLYFAELFTQTFIAKPIAPLQLVLGLSKLRIPPNDALLELGQVSVKTARDASVKLLLGD